MATYPPNQVTPGKGSNGYVWNWLGSPMQKFAAKIATYLPAPTPPSSLPYTQYTAQIAVDIAGQPVVTVLQNNTGLTITWVTAVEPNSGAVIMGSTVTGLNPLKVFVAGMNTQLYGAPGTIDNFKSFTGIYTGNPDGQDLAFQGYLGFEINDGDDTPGSEYTLFRFIGMDGSYAAMNVTDVIGQNNPFNFEFRVYP